MKCFLWPTLLLLPPLAGCAAERATQAAADVARMTATALIEKSHFTDSAAQVNGDIDDPTYTVDAFYVQGVHLQIGLRGVEVKGRISGQGRGDDVALTPETVAALRAQGLSEDDVTRVVKALMGRMEKAPVPAPK